MVSASPWDGECGCVCDHPGTVLPCRVDAQVWSGAPVSAFPASMRGHGQAALPSTEDGAQEPFRVGWVAAAPPQAPRGPCCRLLPPTRGHMSRGLCPPTLHTHPQDQHMDHAFPTCPRASPECVCLDPVSSPCSQASGLPCALELTSVLFSWGPPRSSDAGFCFAKVSLWTPPPPR